MDTNMLESAQTVIKAANYASAQNDRWMFIATLIAFGVVWFYISRYWVRRDEQLLADFREATKRYEASLLAITVQQQKTITELAVVLSKNTEALERCTNAMQKQADRQADCARIQDEFRRLNKII